MSNLATYLLVAFGGAIGTIARYLISVAGMSYSRELPWATIVINVTGSFIIGFFGTLTLSTGRFPVSENMRLFVMVGLCGGYTTFSAFSLQTLDLLRTGATVRALANIGLSVVLCIAAVAMGHAVASLLNNDATPRIAQASIEEEADIERPA
jgi:CrcB protein